MRQHMLHIGRMRPLVSNWMRSVQVCQEGIPTSGSKLRARSGLPKSLFGDPII